MVHGVSCSAVTCYVFAVILLALPPARCQGTEGLLSFTTSHPQKAPPAHWQSRNGFTRHILAYLLTQHLLLPCNRFMAPNCLSLTRSSRSFRLQSIGSTPSSHSHSRSHTLQPCIQSDRLNLLGLEAIEADNLQTKRGVPVCTGLSQ